MEQNARTLVPQPGAARVGEGGGSLPRPTTLFLDGRCDMTRTLIATAVMTLGALFMVFTITMAASYEINERCTEQMASDGNC